MGVTIDQTQNISLTDSRQNLSEELNAVQIPFEVVKSTCKISIIVPLYNEESNLPSLIANLKQTLNETLLDYELILINDGSIDNTIQIIQEEEKSDRRVKTVSYIENKGKGHAVRAGVLKSEGDIVLFFDGDLDISPSEIKNYIKSVEGYDLVIASKAHPLSEVRCPVDRRFLSKMFSLLVRTCVGMKTKDTQSGLKGGNGSVLREIFKIMIVNGYAFDVELLAIASIINIKIRELPIKITLDSSFNFRQITKMFIDTMKISYRIRLARTYQKALQSKSIAQD